jgi:hypothetical protein
MVNQSGRERVLPHAMTHPALHPRLGIRQRRQDIETSRRGDRPGDKVMPLGAGACRRMTGGDETANATGVRHDAAFGRFNTTNSLVMSSTRFNARL